MLLAGHCSGHVGVEDTNEDHHEHDHDAGDGDDNDPVSLLLLQHLVW